MEKQPRDQRMTSPINNFRCTMLCFTPSVGLRSSTSSLHESARTFIPALRIAGTTANRRAARFTMSVTTTPKISRPTQVVLSPLPRLYQYDHCPFCVRVRYCLGVKNVKHEIIWLLNDDAATPTSLVGKKIVPIFAPQGSSGPNMPESLDICNAIDTDPRYGKTGTFRAATGRSDISQWFSNNAKLIRRLSRPRVVNAYLAEFATQDARDAYIRNHPLPEPADYSVNYEMSKEFVDELQPKMKELGDMIHSIEFCSEGGLSMDDIDLFPRLRTLTLIKDLVFPPKLKAYVEYQSKLSDVGLYFVFAS